MIFSFKIDRPRDMKSTYSQLKHTIESEGGSLSGDNVRGSIVLLGVEGEYEVDADYIIISITKKPSPLLPNRLIENEIRKHFQQLNQ